MTDPIADFLTRIRNAVKANHKVVCAIYIGKERCSLGNTDLSGSGFFVYGV